MVHDILDKEVEAGTPSTDILLGGFSQGGAMALLAAYSYSKPLAGVACFSGWPALQADFAERVSKGANVKTPAFVGHGTSDEVVFPECGARANELLTAAGVPTKYETYAGLAHGACPQELSDLKEWVRTALKVEE